MEPPSYEEASRQPSAQPTAASDLFPPPPTYDASLSCPPTPPPAYREAVRPDPFPVLALLSVPTAVTSHPQRSTGVTVHPVTQITVQPQASPARAPAPASTAVSSGSRQGTGVTVHPVTQIGATPRVSSRQTQPTAVVCQPQPVPIAVQYLKDAPGLVRCPHCSHLVTSKVTYVPGTAAWCWCVILALSGLICGFCLIPLMVRGMQDAHHSCPQCGNNLHIHKR
ncbi:lipopolysaccharide-induced tumor necrosis factor-alpha factor homolog [Archocentrus centrarchus]|uniref:lipopolysaccharide-induced tumor necrosis factor-alpha factor homolog n=1 Tax=Archocentrus centrarchus TaxID=63155 RepID=UPI0011E9CF0C|nr:lipopolysaccharide-induced tumor necrosis factor-alpha factor homolog [Archocentrus centrarchus]